MRTFALFLFALSTGCGVPDLIEKMASPYSEEDLSDSDGDGVLGISDCDDADAAVYPGAEEVCNGIDDNCDGSVDAEGSDAVDAYEWFVDADADGYGILSAEAIYLCPDVMPPEGYVLGSFDDCDDGNAAVNPGEPEVCGNGVDDDCDSYVDMYAVDDTVWWPDADGDGWGDLWGSTIACEMPVGFVAATDDCDDANPDISPGAHEVCADYGVDENCDGLADDDDPTTDESTMTIYYVDADADRYGNTEEATLFCWSHSGFTTQDRDCDDTRADINPLEPEVCDVATVDDEIIDDENCDGRVNEYCEEE